MITENHEIDFSTNSTYEESLSKLVKVTVIEAVQGIGEGESTKVKEENVRNGRQKKFAHIWGLKH